VHAIGKLDENHPDVVDHRQEHLAEVLRLALFGGRERDRADLRDALDDVGDLGAEQLLDAIDVGQGVFDDIVEEPGGDGDRVEPELDQKLGNRQRMDEIRLSRPSHLVAMLEGREDVGAPQQLDVGVGAVGSHLVQEVFESNHQIRCLS
jgi:hypothetical protein